MKNIESIRHLKNAAQLASKAQEEIDSMTKLLESAKSQPAAEDAGDKYSWETK